MPVPYATLAISRCPPPCEMLLAIEREFGPLDHEVDESLDDLARPLFGLSRRPADEQVRGVARTAWAALPESGDDAYDWLPAVGLDRGAASGAVRAAVAAEVARRAGLRATPARLPDRWAIHLSDGHDTAAAELGLPSPVEPCTPTTALLCAHQLASVALCALGRTWHSAGDDDLARRACALRRLLPTEGTLRERLRRDDDRDRA